MNLFCPPSPLCGKKRLSLSLLCLLFLFGCSVHPEPISNNEAKQRAVADMQRLFAEQAQPAGDIGLFEAMARAVKYNLDRRVKLMEEAISRGDLALAHSNMLPQIAASAGYNTRNNSPSSVSADSTVPSTSQERDIRTAGLTTVWNVLDFGVGYLQTKQQANQLLIASEQRRRVTQNIIQEVRAVYWRAVLADILLADMDALLQEAQQALQHSQKMEQERSIPPLKALEFQQTLLETTKQIWAARKDLVTAKSELASLMNLRPNSQYRVQGTQAELLDNSLLTLPIDMLEHFSLSRRPELREEDYQEGISAIEVRKAMLGALPGLEFSAGPQFDSNKYLVNQSWMNAGMQLSMNLVSLATAPQRKAAAKMQGHIAQTRRLALSMAALTQLQLSMQGYHLVSKELHIVKDLNSVLDRKMRIAKAAKQADTGNQMDAIRNKAEALFARLQQGLAFVEQQAALGRVYLSLGVDFVPEEMVVNKQNIYTLANQIEIRQHWTIDTILQDNMAPTPMIPTHVVVAPIQATAPQVRTVPGTAYNVPYATDGSVVKAHQAIPKYSNWLERLFFASPQAKPAPQPIQNQSPKQMALPQTAMTMQRPQTVGGVQMAQMPQTVQRLQRLQPVVQMAQMPQTMQLPPMLASSSTPTIPPFSRQPQSDHVAGQAATNNPYTAQATMAARAVQQTAPRSTQTNMQPYYMPAQPLQRANNAGYAIQAPAAQYVNKQPEAVRGASASDQIPAPTAQYMINQPSSNAESFTDATQAQVSSYMNSQPSINGGDMNFTAAAPEISAAKNAGNQKQNTGWFGNFFSKKSKQYREKK